MYIYEAYNIKDPCWSSLTLRCLRYEKDDGRVVLAAPFRADATVLFINVQGIMAGSRFSRCETSSEHPVPTP